MSLKDCGLLTNSCVADLQVPLPEYPTLATNNIVLKLRAREANDIFFRELATVLGMPVALLG